MGKVNCIVVKDYTKLGNFVEKIFPFIGVRFVAVNDNLDTFTWTISINRWRLF